MEGGCSSPTGCWARIKEGALYITAYSACLDGSRHLNKTVHGKIVDAEKMAFDLADSMIQNGAKELVAQ